MASLRIQPYMDRENVGSVGTNPGKAALSQGLGSKLFQSHAKSMVTPRKALGDIQNQIGSISSKTPANSLKKPVIGAQSLNQQKKGLQIRSGKSNFKVKADPQPQLKVPVRAAKEPKLILKQPVGDDIEHIPISLDDPDDFEDILPKEERITTYIKELINWRPPCLFGILPSSDSDDEETSREEERKREDALANLPPPSELFPEAASVAEDLSNFESFPDLDEIEMPSLSDIELAPEINVTSLEDSIDISPRMGQLQMSDSFLA